MRLPDQQPPEHSPADAEHEADLFWAVRGGGGSFGVVTALEFRLFPHTQAYAGALWYPIERASEVLHAWGELTRGQVPDEITTIGRRNPGCRYPGFLAAHARWAADGHLGDPERKLLPGAAAAPEGALAWAGRG